MKRKLLLASFVLFLAACAHGQIPPTTWTVLVSWTMPAPSGTWLGCTASDTCVFGVSRTTVASGTTCPAATNGVYSLIGTTAAQAVTFTDPATSVAAGTSYCYIVQTQQIIPPATQPATSVPSNSAFVAVPPLPGAPTAPSVTPTPGTQAGALMIPATPMPIPVIWKDDAGWHEVKGPQHVKVTLVASR